MNCKKNGSRGAFFLISGFLQGLTHSGMVWNTQGGFRWDGLDISLTAAATRALGSTNN